jgi:hypothetical protein
MLPIHVSCEARQGDSRHGHPIQALYNLSACAAVSITMPKTNHARCSIQSERDDEALQQASINTPDGDMSEPIFQPLRGCAIGCGGRKILVSPLFLTTRTSISAASRKPSATVVNRRSVRSFLPQHEVGNSPCWPLRRRMQSRVNRASTGSSRTLTSEKGCAAPQASSRLCSSFQPSTSSSSSPPVGRRDGGPRREIPIWAQVERDHQP